MESVTNRKRKNIVAGASFQTCAFIFLSKVVEIHVPAGASLPTCDYLLRKITRLYQNYTKLLSIDSD